MIWVVLASGLCALWTGYIYNRLVGLANRSANAWADIDVQLKRRHDLVGNLVEAVKGYTTHERQVLERVTAARALAEQAREGAGPREAGDTESTLAGELDRLIAVVEAYPDLKARQHFLDLQVALTDVEDDLQQARRYYNAVVRRLQHAPRGGARCRGGAGAGVSLTRVLQPLEPRRGRSAAGGAAMMRRRLIVAAGLILVMAIGAPVSAERGGYFIESFDVDLRVQPDAELVVEERLVVDFSAPRHGIYRTIPVDYVDPRGYVYSLGFRLTEVVDDQGQPHESEVTRDGRHVVIRIGSPTVTVRGRVTYAIRYRVRNAVVHFAEHDELYWNATGHEWQASIGQASARVHLPGVVAPIDLETAGFVGAYGSRERNVQADVSSGGAAHQHDLPLRAVAGAAGGVDGGRRLAARRRELSQRGGPGGRIPARQLDRAHAAGRAGLPRAALPRLGAGPARRRRGRRSLRTTGRSQTGRGGRHSG